MPNVSGFDFLSSVIDPRTVIKVLVTVFSPELLDESIKACKILNANDINQELYIDENAKMEKQLKYADRRQIPYVLIIGPNEAKNNTVTLKNLKTREQKTLPLNQALPLFK